MKLTLQADDVRHFRRLAAALIGKPQTAMVQFVVYRNKLAMVLDWYGWMLVMPIRGRKPTKPFRVPLAPLLKVGERAEGKMSVRIDEKKELGMIEGVESHDLLVTHPFPVHARNWKVDPIPEESAETKTFPTPWLSALVKCSRIALGHRYPDLATVRITPDGEFGATDGKRLLLEQTTARFPWEENILVRATDLYRVRLREFKDRATFDLGVRDDWACFDFGDCRFFTKQDIGHYPELHRVLPSENQIRTRLTLDPKDAAFLKKHLDELPGRKDRNSPITLLCDYDRTITVHGETSRPDEMKAILLARSKYEGDAYVVQTNRKYLLDALAFGCRDFHFGTRHPLASTENIRFCWMPLDTCGALPLESECPRNPAVLLRSDEPSTTKD